MEIKPLLALAGMCQRPNDYVGDKIDPKTKRYLDEVNSDISKYLENVKIQSLDLQTPALCRYQKKALHRSIDVLESLCEGRYRFELVNDNNDYLCEGDPWNSPGRQLEATEWVNLMRLY
jgi:hypothetical protein